MCLNLCLICYVAMAASAFALQQWQRLHVFGSRSSGVHIVLAMHTPTFLRCTHPRSCDAHTSCDARTSCPRSCDAHVLAIAIAHVLAMHTRLAMHTPTFLRCTHPRNTFLRCTHPPCFLRCTHPHNTFLRCTHPPCFLRCTHPRNTFLRCTHPRNTFLRRQRLHVFGSRSSGVHIAGICYFRAEVVVAPAFALQQWQRLHVLSSRSSGVPIAGTCYFRAEAVVKHKQW